MPDPGPAALTPAELRVRVDIAREALEHEPGA
jgi:hypothetical protein